MALGTKVGLGPRHIVLDGDPATLSKKGTEPQFSAHCYCGQTAGCIKMLRRLCVIWEPSPLPKKEAEPAHYSAHFYSGQTA